jgi:hypothetical protein
VRSVIVSLVVAAGLTAVLAACQAKPCDPKDWLLSGCDHGETCDAHIRRCMPRTACQTSADCFDGFVCYDDHTCARNCSSGIFPFDYCVEGWTCNRETLVCERRSGG